MSLALAVLPIFLLIAAGHVLTATRVVAASNWPAIESLCFRVLIPVVLIEALITADLSLSRIGPLAVCLLATTGVMSALLLGGRFWISRERLSNRRFTSIFQGSTRWNAFIAFTVSDQIVGPDGRALIAVGVAVLIPTINILNIVILAGFGPESRTPAQVLRTVAANPMVIACAVGLAINITGLPVPVPVVEALSIVGDGALGIGLLTVGAAVSLPRLATFAPALWTAVGLRFVISPLIFLVFATGMSLTPMQTFLGAIMMSVPAATNGYIFAKQMGGDAELFADLNNWQVVLSMLTMPLMAALLL